MNNVLLVCDKILEINKLRRCFNQDFTIKATSSVQSGAFVAESSLSDIVIYHIGSDFKHLFNFYKDLRNNPATKNIPLIVIADFNILKILTETIKLNNAKIIGTTISIENMQSLVASLLIP